jgi:preprotein translocase subunit SecA
MKKLIYSIKEKSDKLKHKTSEELSIEIEKVKKRVKKENLDDLLVDWFSIVQEISYREIGLRHFDTQLLAGILLHNGNIVEMKTGEGKTLASTLPVALNALSKKGVHVVTVNEYLAERDQKTMGKIYDRLGLSSGLIKSTKTLKEKKVNYSKDISYVTNSEVVFDHLRDSSAYNLEEIVQRPFNFCVIDEIDSILIDEARTPLIISSSDGYNNINKLYVAKALANSLIKDVHFQVDEKRKDINLTDEGYLAAQNKLGKESLYDPDDPWILEILNALKALYLFKINKDYIVLKNKVIIVDEFTGRVMEDRRWSMGIHEAVEIKEEVNIGKPTKTKSSITYQNFFTLYPKLTGMTGTAKTTEKEFKDIYGLDVVVLPTAKPMIRKDLPDLVYQTEIAKWRAVLNESKKCYEKGQPILIGTATVEKSEFLSDLFKISKIPHQVLNAKPENITRENEIIALAGERYAVTIATNMAGRGTDIILGGNPSFKVKEEVKRLLLNETKADLFLIKENGGNKEDIKDQKIDEFIGTIEQKYKDNKNNLVKDIENLPYSLEICAKELKDLYNHLLQKLSNKWKDENNLVKILGGLYVLGTERHETRRIDNQLRGRAGRQGDPGKSQFYVSLDDELLKIFGGDNIRKWVESLIEDKDEPLESNLLTNSLENAQKKVELYNYDLRKNVFQYDDILNSQRKQLFKGRNDILFENIYENLFLRYGESILDQEIEVEETTEVWFEKKKHDEIEKFFDSYSTHFQKNEKGNEKKKINSYFQEIWITNDLRYAHSNIYSLGLLKNTKATTLLYIIDFYWTEHLERMSYIRETINWRSYGQQNPLIEYNFEAFNSFKLMFKQIRSYMIYYFLASPISFD